MNGIHDMGGLQDMGPVQHERDEPVFHAAWEGRVYAINSRSELPASRTLMRGAIKSNCFLQWNTCK